MKRLLSIFLAVLITLSIFTALPECIGDFKVTAYAEDTGVFQLNKSEDGTYYILNRVDKAASGEITIPESYNGKPIKFIGAFAFSYCPGVTTVNIPGTVTDIGSQAFYRAEGIQEINISEGLKRIGNDAFSGCYNLKKLTLPKGILDIGSYILRNTQIYNDRANWEDNVFYIDNYLIDTELRTGTSAVVKDGTTIIASNAFAYWSNLKSITLPDTLTRIGDSGFASSGLESIIIPDSVTAIDSYAFNYCENLNNVTLPAKITKIDYAVFQYCSKLDNVVVPEGVTGIDGFAFDSCSNLANITLPDTVSSIASDAFYGTKIYQKPWENGALYINNHLIKVESDKIIDTFDIKPDTVHIANAAFQYCNKLVMLTMPGSVKAIGYNAFRECGNLKTIFFEGSMEEYHTIDFTNNGEYLRNTMAFVDASREYRLKTPELTSLTNVWGGVQINWKPVYTATHYRIYRRGAGSSEWQFIGETDKTSFVDRRAKNNAYWRYSVRAIGYSSYSEFDTNGKFIKYAQAPTLTGISNATNGIYVKWNSVANASGYRVYRRGAGEKYWTYITTVNTPYYTDPTVKNSNGNYYRYTVRAVVGNYYSGYHTGIYIKRLANPTLKSATNATNGINVTWSSIYGATGYNIYRKTANSGWVKIGSVSGVNKTTFLDKNVTKGTTYTYTVRATSGSTTSYFYSGISCKRK